MKNLIVGANSFLARSITKQLLDYGQTVEGVINNNRDQLLPQLNYYQTENLSELPDDYDYVYILSAYIPKCNENEITSRLFDINVGLTENIVKQFSNAKIIYASSVSIYGNQEKVLDEQSPSLSPNPYGLSKLWGEQIVRLSEQFAIVRISSMYGEGMKTDTFIPQIIESALKKNEISIWGDGSRQQNYISVDTVAEYMVAASQQSTNETYLAVDHKSYSNLEVAKLIQQYSQCELVFFGTDNSISYYYNNEFSVKNLDIQSKHPFEQNIEGLIKWIEKMSL